MAQWLRIYLQCGSYIEASKMLQRTVNHPARNQKQNRSRKNLQAGKVRNLHSLTSRPTKKDAKSHVLISTKREVQSRKCIFKTSECCNQHSFIFPIISSGKMYLCIISISFI